MEPTIFQILLGRHGYSLTPELETSWCRFCLLVGLVAGFVGGLMTGGAP